MLYKLADIGTNLARQYSGAVGDVARALGGSLVPPPVDAAHIQRYFGDVKGFGAIDELVTIVTNGVPVKAAPRGSGVDRVLQYGSHRSAAEHLPAIWRKLSEDVRRQKCIPGGNKESAAQEIPNACVSPLGAAVTHKVRIINDSSFEVQNKATKYGLNADTDPDSVPQCLCAEALPKLLAELVSLRIKFPTKRILMSKADVSDAFRNVRIDPDEAHNFCYMVGELIVIDFRLTFGWSGSPGFWGVMSAAAEHAHCNTTLASAQILGEGADMMAHVKVVDRWEE